MLHLDAVGIDAGFLDLGGDSMQATQLAILIGETVAADISAEDVFEAPTVAGMASLIRKRRTGRAEGDDEKMKLERKAFYNWAYGDLLSNTTRSVLAEYIVGVALGVVDQPRIEWNSVDLCFKGLKIEVKAGGFAQAWETDRPSSIVFDIAPRKDAWDSATNKSIGGGRHADVYVFCVHKEKEQSKADPLDLDQWDFYVTSTAEIVRIFGEQKSVALNRITQTFSAKSFSELRPAIKALS